MAHAERAAPEECCGLLMGDAHEIAEAVAVRNGSDSPTTRYRIDPQDHLHAIRQARARGLHVIGAYHSHPHSVAVPSETDAAEAFGDFLFVIVGLEPRLDLAAWAWCEGNFVRVSLVRLPEGKG